MEHGSGAGAIAEPEPKSRKGLRLGTESFFEHRTLAQLAASQGIGPLRNATAVGGLIANDEVDDFVEAIYNARNSATSGTVEDVLATRTFFPT